MGGLYFVKLVSEPWAEPFFCFFDALIFALCVVFDLIFLDIIDHEVVRVGVGEVDATDCGAGVHGTGLGEFDPSLFSGVEEVEEDGLFGVIRLRGIAGSGANTLVFFVDEL